jgi:type I restriction-modification system DNA methylase subunit
MSEELLQTAPFWIGRYAYYKIGNTTMNQLKKAKIINKTAKTLSEKRPDGLIALPGGIVKAVIEYKTPEELSTKTKIDAAIRQELGVARLLCKLLIVTDGSKTFWINALNGEEIIQNSKKITYVFDAERIASNKITIEEKIDLENLIDQAEYSLSKINNVIVEPEILDPTPLAKEVWQKIWINTGKEPEKCLYNVVEIFVFKFLSDIGVLNFTNNFNSVYEIKQRIGIIDALKHYANSCRKTIKDDMFPSGKDGTTIFNGTIFINEKGEANLSQATLFGLVIDSFQKYDEKYGSFKYVTKEFKTRLYETFLRQSAGVKNLGQYFTPRNVVQAMVKMSNASTLNKGARICDPFCGVGGFVLEVISMTPSIFKGFEPINGEIAPQISVSGYDKGTDEKDDERTIILAKANMLIYFSDLLAKYHSQEHLKSFSNNAFNKVFHLLKTNLGTFRKVDDEPYDLILTNPPYVTSGSRTLKDAISGDANIKLRNYYTYNGRGTEALSIEWIIKNLKPGGQALAVVPDGLMLQNNIINKVKEDCIVQAIISLPIRTFYSTPKKTYILAIVKKEERQMQDTPVFTYLVSEIGETRDAKRFNIEENNLNEMTQMFTLFKAGVENNDSSRCKIIPFNDFDSLKHWQIDKRWTLEERIVLGIEEQESIISINEFKDIVEGMKNDMDLYNTELEGLINGDGT